MKRLLAALAIVGAATTAHANPVFNGGHLDFYIGTIVDGSGAPDVGILEITGAVDFTIDNFGVQFGSTSQSFITGGSVAASFATSSIHAYHLFDSGNKAGLYYKSGLFFTGGEVGIETLLDLGEADIQMSIGTVTDGSGTFSYGLGVYFPLSDRVELYGLTSGLADGANLYGNASFGAMIGLNAPGWSLDANINKWYDEDGFYEEAYIQFGVRKDLGGKGGLRLFGEQPFFLFVV